MNGGTHKEHIIIEEVFDTKFLLQFQKVDTKSFLREHYTADIEQYLMWKYASTYPEVS